MHKLFPGQIETEKIRLVVREHWMYFALKIFGWFFFLGLYIAFKFISPLIWPDLQDSSLNEYVSLASYLYLMFLTLSLFVLWVIYYLNMQIITDMRVVDIDQEGLFSHTTSELNIAKVEDVTSEVKGLLGTMFNYGNVYVQTAGAVERFEFTNVPSPANIQKLIQDSYENLTKKGTVAGQPGSPSQPKPLI